MRKIINHTYFQIFVSVFFALILIFYFINLHKEKNEKSRLAKIEQTLLQTSPFNSVETVSKSYAVFDVTDHKKIYGKNDEMTLPLASLTKIMTAFVALNILNQDDIIKIDDKSLSMEGDSGFVLNQSFALRDLIIATLVSSSNDGAYAIALASELKNSIAKNGDVPDFLQLMNKKAQNIGMTNFNFQSVTGLDRDGNIPTSFSSASDMTILLAKAYLSYPDIFSFSSAPQVTIQDIAGDSHIYKNTNELSGEIDNILMSKTGYTESAGGNLAVLYKARNNHIVALVLLGSTRDDRFSDMKKMIEATEAHFTNLIFVLNNNQK